MELEQKTRKLIVFIYLLSKQINNKLNPKKNLNMPYSCCNSTISIINNEMNLYINRF